jgi:hypothetical protein
MGFDNYLLVNLDFALWLFRCIFIGLAVQTSRGLRLVTPIGEAIGKLERLVFCLNRAPNPTNRAAKAVSEI